MLYQDLIKDSLKSPEDMFFDLANAKSVSYRTKHGFEVSVEQNSCIENSTGGIVWETAYLLATYIESNVALESHPKILEVGSGCGLLGTALSYEGAHVICTETENTMATLEKNINKHKKLVSKDSVKGLGGKLKARTLRWDHPADRDYFENVPFNIIIGTDIFFDVKLVAPLLETMRTLSHSKTEVYLCFQERCAEAHAEFLRISLEYFSIVENRSDELYATAGCGAAEPLECFLFYMSRAIPTSKDKLGERKESKKKMKKDKKKEEEVTVLDGGTDSSSVKEFRGVSGSSSTSATLLHSKSSTSWFEAAFQKAADRAEPDVTFPESATSALCADIEQEDGDFNGTAVASMVENWTAKQKTTSSRHRELDKEKTGSSKKRHKK